MGISLSTDDAKARLLRPACDSWRRGLWGIRWGAFRAGRGNRGRALARLSWRRYLRGPNLVHGGRAAGDCCVGRPSLVYVWTIAVQFAELVAPTLCQRNWPAQPPIKQMNVTT